MRITITHEGERIPTLAEVTEAHIAAVLLNHQGSVVAAAKTLDINRCTLYRKLKRKSARLLQGSRDPIE